MIPLTYSDIINLRMDECCKNLLTYRAADTIRRNFIECLRPFGIKFKDDTIWHFENIKVIKDKNEHCLFEVDIDIRRHGISDGIAHYFNDGNNFYLLINLPRGYYVYDSSKDILSKSNYEPYIKFINDIYDTHNLVFDAKELWRKECLERQLHELSACPYRIVLY